MTIKQAIIIRADLQMSPGKIAAQAVHAANQLLLEQMSTEFKTVPVFLVDEMTKKIGPTYQKDVVLKTMMFDPKSVWHEWTSEVTTVVVLSAPSLEVLYELRDRAASLDVPFSIFQDNGGTCSECDNKQACESEILNETGRHGAKFLEEIERSMFHCFRITTCMAIGPAEDGVLDKITGDLQKL